MGIIVAFMLFVPVLYSSYIVPLAGEGPTVSLVVVEPIAAPNVTVPDVLGVSVDWTDNANGLYDDRSGLLNPTPVGELIGLDPSHLRFPATRLSQAYNWIQGVGNRNERGYNPSHGPKPQVSLFGTDEFFKLVDHTGSRAVMVVNSNTGTTAMASDWVSYCNDNAFTRKGRDRAANGYSTPYGIKEWEIGYEPYLPRYWEGIPSGDEGIGGKYGQLVRNYSLAMKSIDPSIKVGAWMVLHPDIEIESSDRSWNLNFLNQAEGQFNLGGDDLYYFDYVVVRVVLPDIDTLLSYPELYKYSYAQTVRTMLDDLAQLRGLLATKNRYGNPIPIAIASFEPSFGEDGWNTKAPANAASALLTADMAIQLLNVALDGGRQSLKYACYGELNTPTYSSLMINPDFDAAHLETWGKSPNYLAFQLCSELQGNKPLRIIELEPVTYDVAPERELTGVNNVPLVSAIAVGDPEDGKVWILLINRDITRSVDCRISIDMTGLSPRPELSQRSIQFDSLLDTNLAEEKVTAPLPNKDSKFRVDLDGFFVTLERAGVMLLTLGPPGVS
jgi:alpha-L-arabinofuranosidase